MEVFFIGPTEVADIGIAHGKGRLAYVYVGFVKQAIGLLDPERLKVLEDRKPVTTPEPLLEFIHVQAGFPGQLLDAGGRREIPDQQISCMGHKISLIQAHCLYRGLYSIGPGNLIAKQVQGDALVKHTNRRAGPRSCHQPVQALSGMHGET